MYCNKCGKEIAEWSTYCSFCGQRVDGVSAPSYTHSILLKCKACGGSLSIGTDPNVRTLSCPFCGAKELLVESESVVTERIRSQAYRDIEFDRHAKDAEIARIRQEANDRMALAQQEIARAKRDAEIARSKADIEIAKSRRIKEKHPLATSIIITLLGLLSLGLSLLMISVQNENLAISGFLFFLSAGIVLLVIGFFQRKKLR